ncbi:hypothetical protein AQJ91_18155 [Streptomyces dysideae]|uniref:Uncharacterized protein n=1 Tax=Streptomyces dysideae TaxID=909626 RepID=A0A101UZI9_9ACTN|nr:hypothetical protein AQJ91_18155 [Streptomyces dysideae]
MRYPSPQQWTRVLRRARHRRAPHLWPSPELAAAAGAPITGALVRAYVLPEGERTRALAASVGEGR